MQHLDEREGALHIWGSNLAVALQPIVDLRSGAVAAYEALFRPRTGEKPDEVLGRLGPTVRNAVERELLVTAIEVGLPIAAAIGVPLAVNLSPPVAADPATRDLLARCLIDTIEPSQLVVEITEETRVHPAIVAGLAELAALGIGIVLDDLGTGHANVGEATCLARCLPLHGIKVGLLPEDGAPHRLIDAARLARRHDLALTVEQVETERDLEMARFLGAHFGQGFLLGKPTIVAVQGAA